MLDLRREEVRRALGVALEDLTGAREAAQGLADRARELGAIGLVVPSAARADAWNLVVMPQGFDRVRTRGSRVHNPA